MTGIGGLLFEPAPKGGDSRWKKLLRRIRRERMKRDGKNPAPTRFVVLCFRRTGSNWLCGLLFNHPQILMHNELFNENGVHTYYKGDILRHNWDYEGRDVNPDGFLEFVFKPSKFSKFSDDDDNEAEKCKAVGYKSFPNHYLQHGVPLAKMDHAYQTKVLTNPDVKKIILMREDVIRTYLSSRRAFETGSFMTRYYQDYKVHVDLVDMQRFIDGYDECYEHYSSVTQGHPRCKVTYESLCQDTPAVMTRIWHLLGVRHVDPVGLAECKPQSSSKALLRDSIHNYDHMEFAYRHDPRLSQYLDVDKMAQEPSGIDVEPSSLPIPKTTEATSDPKRWVLIVPVRAGPDDDVASCRNRLECFYTSLKATTQGSANLPILLFGVDDDDHVYNDSDLLQSLFGETFAVHVMKLSGLQGKICKIWRRLAVHAYTDLNADFTCLLGDDIELHDPNWQETMEQYFAHISETRGLPFGAACVAFKDCNFPGFPTFPVIHKWHFHALGGTILPSLFDNQGGDPFLFELYKRFRASQFAMECTLTNTIGGKADARYTKQRLRFEDDILTSAIRQVSRKLKEESYEGDIVLCMDIVVPAYRCDIPILERITQLRASWPVQVSFWIVLDNPDHPLADKVRAMQTTAQNYQINILEQLDRFGKPRNYGASAARNYGLAHSKADHAILLDDDVLPEKTLLDAYLGAAMRWPNASVLVGSTHFPPPSNVLTHAIVASDIPGAFTIAERTRNPPWGVTANLCVRARTSRLRFDLSYPKTGGGEDLDFCARAQHHGPIKAVPGAKALHPWWYDGGWRAIGQILGWAEGEVRCVGMPELRKHVFWTAPNGVEMMFMLLTVPFWLEWNNWLGALYKTLIYSSTVLCLELLWHCSGIGSHRLRGAAKTSMSAATQVRLLAGSLILMQEATRFFRALQNSPRWIFWRMDWHFGQNPYWLAKKKRHTAWRAIFYALLFVVWMNPSVVLQFAPSTSSDNNEQEM